MSKKGKEASARARAMLALKEMPLPGAGVTEVMNKALGRAKPPLGPYVDPKLYRNFRKTMLKRKRTPQEKAIDQGEADAFRIRWAQWVKEHQPKPPPEPEKLYAVPITQEGIGVTPELAEADERYMKADSLFGELPTMPVRVPPKAVIGEPCCSLKPKEEGNHGQPVSKAD